MLQLEKLSSIHRAKTEATPIPPKNMKLCSLTAPVSTVGTERVTNNIVLLMGLFVIGNFTKQLH